MIGIRNSRIAKVWLAGVGLVIVGTCVAATEYKQERYNVILDRSPFGSDPLQGAIPDNSAEDRAAAAAAAAAAKSFRLSFLLEGEDGEIRAGFEHLKPKKGEAKSSIIMVGESFMGMKLMDVDFFNSSATLDQNGKQIRFELSKGPAVAKAPSKPASQPQRRFGGGFRRTPPKQPEKPKAPELTPEEQKLRREEIRANLQNYQMEVIRSGMPPLPIPLTPEMDDQLVAEGVLPPE
jgi:hypothetical protein